MTRTSFVVNDKEWSKFKKRVMFNLHSRISYVLPAMVENFNRDWETEEGKSKAFQLYFKKCNKK